MAPTSSRSRLFGLTTEECNLGTVVANPEKFPEQYALVKEGSPIYHVTPDDPPVSWYGVDRRHGGDEYIFDKYGLYEPFSVIVASN